MKNKELKTIKTSSIVLTNDELQKFATLISESGKIIKEATSIANSLLSDNIEISKEIEMLKTSMHDEKRDCQINKIASLLKKKGIISNTAMDDKIAELKKMSDSFLQEFEQTLAGLDNSSYNEKKASLLVNGEDGTFATLDFMSIPQVESTEKTANTNILASREKRGNDFLEAIERME